MRKFPGVKAISSFSPLSCPISLRRPHCHEFARSLVTEASSAPAPAPGPGPPNSHESHLGRKKPRVPRLCPFNSYRATPNKLVAAYTNKLGKGYPMLIRNLPGFLDEQNWIEHLEDSDGALKNPPSQSLHTTLQTPGFDVLKAILASATGSIREDPALDLEYSKSKTVFDDFIAQCKISTRCLDGDDPPFALFCDWLPTSPFKEHSSLVQTLAEILESYDATRLPWVPFEAPLVFFRAVHQYNRHRIKESGVDLRPEIIGPDSYPPSCIDGLSGLVVLQEELTEEFPFPRIVRDIGKSSYGTKSCSIRVGVRPLRSSMRQHNKSTVVVGQLAGYSVVTMVRPEVKLLNGQPLDSHERVPKPPMRINPYPLRPRLPNITLPSKTWTNKLEKELTASGDVLLATLIPGDGLLVPEGWWYNVRSINNEVQLHATVTWFLGREDLPLGDQAEYQQGDYIKRFTPRVEI
ncbi:hypothetical protein F4808DRAFT_398997 [Astrocystis sublimbata]|nr:hypothetical protein F4808DRAFT_398997 [Astrocystis sublimbata]